MEDHALSDSNITTSAEVVTESDLSDGIPQILSTVITLSFLLIVVAVIYTIYRVSCKSRSKHHGTVENGDRKEFFDQFDVNCSQLNLEAEEKKFVNPAAKITSESESTSSSVSTTSPERNGALNMLVKSIHGEPRFAVSKIRERSSRPSSLKIKVPRQFVGSTDASEDEQFALALIDKRSNTIHNIELNDCVVVDKHVTSTSLTPTSALFAQRWKDKTRQRRARRANGEIRKAGTEGRTRYLLRQASCPHSMSAKGSRSESLSSHSEDDNSFMKHAVSLSSIDESAHKHYDSAIFSQ